MPLDALLPDSVRLVRGIGGLPAISATGRWGSCTVLLYGADVVSWIPSGGAEVFWIGKRNTFTPGDGIRGGVPICFPRFGGADPVLPKHGFLWRRPWTLAGATDESGVIDLVFRTEADAGSLDPGWPNRFEAVFTVTLAESLGLSLDIRNTDDHSYLFEEALHPYFQVSDVGAVSINGEPLPTSGAMISIPGPSRVSLADRGAERSIEVSSPDSTSSVVWNPGSLKAEAAGDFGPEEWRSMVCVEPGNVEAQSVHLAPGERHRFSVSINVAHN